MDDGVEHGIKQPGRAGAAKHQRDPDRQPLGGISNRPRSSPAAASLTGGSRLRLQLPTRRAANPEQATPPPPQSLEPPPLEQPPPSLKPSPLVSSLELPDAATARGSVSSVRQRVQPLSDFKLFARLAAGAAERLEGSSTSPP